MFLKIFFRGKKNFFHCTGIKLVPNREENMISIVYRFIESINASRQTYKLKPVLFSQEKKSITLPISLREHKILHRVMTFTDFNTSFTLWL